MKHIVIAISLSVLAACAATDTGEEPREGSRSDCIYGSSIRGYTVLDESNLIVSASGRREYHVTLRRRAHGLNSSWAIAFDSTTSRICEGFSDLIFESHFDRKEKIRIATIRQINEEEKEDLLIRFGKRKPEIEQTPAPSEVEGAEVEELDSAATDDTSSD